MNSHNMTTRSKSKNIIIEINPPNDNFDEDDEIDEHGNLKGFIDYDCDEEFDRKELDNVLNGFSRKKLQKKRDNKNKINDLLMSYLILKATDKANLKLKNKRKRKNRNKEKEIIDLDDHNSNENITILNTEFPDTDSDDESFTSTNEESTTDDNNIDDNIINEKEDDEDDDEDYSYEYDDLDEKYEELIDKQMLQNSEESNMEYFHYLEKDKKENFIKKTKEIYEYNGSNIPLRFKVIESEMDMKTKAIALENIDKMSEMDVSTGEHSKMDHWINGLMRIPFGKYNKIPINPDSDNKSKREYINPSLKLIDFLKKNYNN